MSNNLKGKIKRKGVCLLSFTSSSKFERLSCKENANSFFGFFVFFLLIFNFFLSQIDLRCSHSFLKHNLSPLLQLYSKYSIDFYVFSFFFLCDFSLQDPPCPYIFYYFFCILIFLKKTTSKPTR